MNYFKISLIIFMIIKLTKTSPPHQCGLYGMPPCAFLPAPPGSTPSCAAPGKTYCEHVPHYPVHVIKHLIQKWGYDFNSLLADETGEEFNSVNYHRTPAVTISHFYGPPQTISTSATIPSINTPVYGPPGNQIYSANDGYKYGPPNNNNNNNQKPNYGGIYNEEYAEPIYIPRPNNNGYNHYSSNNYHTPNYHGQKNSGGYNYYSPQTQYNQADHFKRYIRDLAGRQQQQQTLFIRHTTSERLKKRSIIDDFQFKNAQNLFLDRISLSENDDVKSRKKRQSPGRTSLCQTRSSFIQPQAALSSKGNWMFVVNQLETARQLVKTETCASNICSNLCQLPNGYNSRCEQKFVQKRLVALEGNGQKLYTDTFWFPSCCVCTIST